MGDFAEDALSIPQPSPAGENKFDGTNNPDRGEAAPISPDFGENKFPRETGSDSLTEEEAQLS